MKVIVKPRSDGKTHQLIKLADDNNGYIVCINRREVERVMEQAKDMGCRINFPITFDEFLSKRYYVKGIKKVFIDNADLLLQYMSDLPIEGITVTGVEEAESEGHRLSCVSYKEIME